MDGRKTVLLVGTLDTKGDEYAYLRDRLALAGVEALVADVGTLEPPHGCEPDITREEVAAAAGVDLAALTEARDRGAAVTAMAEAAAALARRLYDEGAHPRRPRRGRLRQHGDRDRAMQALPVGVPKLMVSTVAAGRHARLRRRRRRDADGLGHRRRRASTRSRAQILANAAAAMAGMVQARRRWSCDDAAPARGRDDVRRHDAVRHARARGARGARLRGAGLPRHRHRRPGDGGARRGRLPAAACST